MKNIFQGNNQIQRCVAETLGYNFDKADAKFRHGWFTEEIYFPAFFYLFNRFGAPTHNDDDYKTAGYWDFAVKDFLIRVEFSSHNIRFIVFGKKWHGFGGLSTGDVKYFREAYKHRGQLISFDFSNYSEADEKLYEKVAGEFLTKKGLRITEKNLEKEIREWMIYVQEYNNKIIGVDKIDYNEKYGNDYSNSYTRRALTTLRQFICNMLTPIWIRDCGYNLKGRCGNEYEKFVNNIKIEKIAHENN